MADHAEQRGELLAAAQADYERRIRSALEPAALSRQEAVGWTSQNHIGFLRSERPSAATIHNTRNEEMGWTVPLYASPVPAEPSAEGWRPIETAPKDGSLFLAWNKTVGAVVASIPASTAHYKKIEVNVNGGRAFIRPTHWLPLPPAPHGEGA